jgi:hypothetical protein
MNTTPDPAILTPAPVLDFSDPKLRSRLRDQLRAEEWAMHLQLLDLARSLLQNLRENPHRTTVADVPRILDLASRLARLATEAEDDRPEVPDTSVLVAEFKVALKKVYARRVAEGRPLPPGVTIDTPSTVTPEPPTDL